MPDEIRVHGISQAALHRLKCAGRPWPLAGADAITAPAERVNANPTDPAAVDANPAAAIDRPAPRVIRLPDAELAKLRLIAARHQAEGRGRGTTRTHTVQEADGTFRIGGEDVGMRVDPLATAVEMTCGACGKAFPVLVNDVGYQGRCEHCNALVQT